MAPVFSPLVSFEISPVFVTADRPGDARDDRRLHRIPEAPPAGGREELVIKLGDLVMILDLHRQGLSVSAIARQVGVDRKTIRTSIAKGWSRQPTRSARRRRALSMALKRICARALRPIPP